MSLAQVGGILMLLSQISVCKVSIKGILMKYLSDGPMGHVYSPKFVNINFFLATHACFAIFFNIFYIIISLPSPAFQARQITVTIRYDS